MTTPTTARAAAEVALVVVGALRIAAEPPAFFCFRGSKTRRRERVFPAVGAATSALVAMHALVDFSLQIPAVALLFTILLGIGVAQAWSTARAPE